MKSHSSVLFLDVDGVLNTYGSGFLYTITRSKIRFLESIVKETDCSVVISSAWRIVPESMKVLRKKLSYRDIYPFDVTPRLNGPRGLEIAAWIEDHPEVLKYAILDDVSDMLDFQQDSFFQTDGEIGLTKEIADRVIYHLTH